MVLGKWVSAQTMKSESRDRKKDSHQRHDIYRSNRKSLWMLQMAIEGHEKKRVKQKRWVPQDAEDEQP